MSTKRFSLSLLAPLAIAVACAEQFPQPNERNTPPAPPVPWGLDEAPRSGCLPPEGSPSKALVGLERLTMFPLDGPVEVVSQSGRIYVVEVEGRIRILPKDGSTPPLVLDIGSKIASGGEAGLLGLAFHPKFAENGFVYLYFTAPHPQSPENVAFQSVLARYESKDGGLTLDPTSEKRILVVDQPYSNHNGGTILFGKDGLLYWGLGDGGAGGDPQDRAQNKNELLGKMLRIDVDGGDPYAIPPTNPYATNGAGKPEIFALGFRNPYRFRIDTVTGELWAGDVGQVNREEIDKITLGGNYGWNIREGKTCYKPAMCDPTGLIDPIVDHDRSEATSITGGVVYHGTKIPALTGKYVYGDFGTGNFWAIPTNEAAPKPLLISEDLPRISPSAFALDPDGEILVASWVAGTVYRLVPPPPPPTAPTRLIDTGCVNPTDPTKPVVGLIPYDVAVPQWMDGATAERYLAIPREAKLKVLPEGRLELPPDGVAMRFIKDARGVPLEVQLVSRKKDGTYGAHRYAWATGEKDATLDETATAQCLLCHDPKVTPTIGLEAAQLDRAGADYGNGRKGNPLVTLDHIQLLDAPIPDVRALSPLDGYGSADLRARSYLHANCAFCHRGGEGTTLDLRYGTPVRSTQACDVPGILKTGGRVRLAPGNPDDSQIITSMRATAEGRMPPVGTTVPHDAAIRAISEWVRDLRACD